MIQDPDSAMPVSERGPLFQDWKRGNSVAERLQAQLTLLLGMYAAICQTATRGL